MYCRHCGTQIEEGAKFCPHCGSSQSAPKGYADGKKEDRSSVGFNFLSFLFPVVGLIFFLCWKQEFPVRAKGCGVCALISVVVGIALLLVFFLFVYPLFFHAIAL